MALCINDIYELKSMKKMTLLAGMGGIMNPVCSVGIADYEFADSFLEATNDDAQAFEKDSLVISSLLFAEHNPDAILPAIKFLHHTGTAGFAFKTVVYNTLPQEVLDYANAHNYPIFRFGRDLMFEDVIFEVFEAVNRDDKENLSLQNLEGMIAHRLSSDEVHTIAKNLTLLFDKYVMGVYLMPNSDEELRHPHLNAAMRNKAVVSRFHKGIFVIMTFSKPEKDKFEIILSTLLEENSIRRETVSIYRSEIHRPFDDLDRCISESYETYLAANKVSQYYGSYTNIGTFQFLLPLKDRTELVDFSKNITARLETNRELLETALCYVSNLGNIQSTATQCCCHANSIRYRLTRIRSLLGMENTTECDFYEQLSIALRVYMIRNG